MSCNLHFPGICSQTFVPQDLKKKAHIQGRLNLLVKNEKYNNA